MKDWELEKVFNGYFEGIDTPDNLTQDAKKHVKKRSAILPAFAKYASIAASFVAVVAVGAVLVSRANLFGANNATRPPELLTYTDGQLTKNSANVYTLTEIDSSLKFIQDLALIKNASVNNVERAAFEDSATAHVYAEISLVTDTRYDAEIYVEFTEYTYAPLVEYTQGESGYYCGINYKLVCTTDENSGELVTMLYARKENIKYYFTVLSSDSDSYIKFLQMIL